MFKSTDFYAPLVMSGNHVLVSPSMQVYCRIFATLIPDYMLNTLEESADEVFSQITSKHVVNDSQGPHTCIQFGSIIERGGSGQIRMSKNNMQFKDFIKSNSDLWSVISGLARVFCPEVTEAVELLPAEHRIFDMFSIGFLNMTPTRKIHRDVRDWRWCFVIPFGAFTQGFLDLPFLNTKVDVRRGDVACFDSKTLWHNVTGVIGGRKSIVLTTHRSVVNRFVDLYLLLITSHTPLMRIGT